MPRYDGTGPMGMGSPFAAPYTRETEINSLKDQAAFLKDELDAINSRLREMESESK